LTVAKELYEMSKAFKKQRPPKVCDPCLKLIQVDSNVICTSRGCFCSHETGTTLCLKHKRVDAIRNTSGNDLFKNDSKPGANDYLMCLSCRDSVKVSTALARKRAKKRKTEFTPDEKQELHVKYRGRALPELRAEATNAQTFFLDELWPHEWCRVYPLLCGWEASSGQVPDNFSQWWTDKWIPRHCEFVVALTETNNNALVPREHTKEIAFPRYQTHRLLRALSVFKKKYKPEFLKVNNPSIEEWLLLMSEDPVQGQRLSSTAVQLQVRVLLMRDVLQQTPSVMRIVGMAGH
jgi:hypothetical protein